MLVFWDCRGCLLRSEVETIHYCIAVLGLGEPPEGLGRTGVGIGSQGGRIEVGIGGQGGRIGVALDRCSMGVAGIEKEIGGQTFQLKVILQ